MITLREATQRLADAGCEDATYCARELFRHFEGLTDTQLYGRDPVTEKAELCEAVAARASGEPLAYILGYTDFYHERYRVTPDVLIPRPETEELVAYAAAHLPVGAQVLDLCTGSGCIGLSVLAHTTDTKATLVDISGAALAIARDNARRLSLAERTHLVRSDVLHEVVDGTFDAILSNPPYVNDALYPTLSREIRREPRIAFVGGSDGMDFYRAILRSYTDRLKPCGFMVLEIGYDQGERIRALGQAAGLTAELKQDLAGLDRIAILRKGTP